MNSSTVLNKFAAPTKLVPQSLCICSIGPRREMKRHISIKKVSVDKPEASSRCTLGKVKFGELMMPLKISDQRSQLL